MDLETILVHGLTDHPLASVSVSPPLIPSTTFLRESDGSYPTGYSYSRRSSPNRDALEHQLAAIEGGEVGVAFASGTAAAMAIFQSLAAGDHVVVAKDAYYGTHEMLSRIFPRWGLSHTLVDFTDIACIAAAIESRTKLLWIETPSNPLLKITDIKAVADVGRAKGLTVVADNTLATPLGQNPLQLGCNAVVHSNTKYINGHSDVLGGVVIGRNDELMDRVRVWQVHGGAVPSAFDCWLTLRGLKTLAHRFRAQCENAMVVAAFLSSHPQVCAVYYPGLASHPQHELALQQMRAFGGLLSFRVHGGRAKAMQVVANTKLIRRATSLGGVESLIEHRASMEGAVTHTPDDLIRLSVGLESPRDLVEDLKSALALSSF